MIIIQYPGSSHVRRLARPERHVAYVSVSGGGCEHVTQYITHRHYLDLTLIIQVILLVGGNQLSKLRNHVMVANEEPNTVKTAIETLARFIKVRIPGALVYTLDSLPRVTENSWFNCRARIVNNHLTKAHADHFHVTFFDSLVVVSRKGRKNRHDRLSTAKKFIDDGEKVHLNHAGYAMLRRILEWLMAQPRNQGQILTFEAEGIPIEVQIKY